MTLDKDPSVEDCDVSEEQVKEAIRTINILSSVFGDGQDNLKNMVRVLEVIYGVEYEVGEYEHQNLEKVIEDISPEDAKRLEPDHVKQKVLDASTLKTRFKKSLEHNMFDDTPLISHRERED